MQALLLQACAAAGRIGQSRAMGQAERPHFVWIGVIGLAAVGLAALAWTLWTGSGAAEPATPDPGTADLEAEQRTSRRAELQALADAAIADERFEDANGLLADAEELGWTEELEAARARLELREATFRAEPRPIEFRVASIEASDEVDELFARVSVNGIVVFETETFAPPAPGEETLRECVVTVRSSFDEGATFELLAPGGMIGGPDRLLGPARVAPLARLEGGRLEFGDPDAPVRRVTIAYRESPYEPGLSPDEPPPSVPADAAPAKLIAAIQAALATDQLDAARSLVARLEREAPGHPDLAFTRQRLESRADYLEQNRTRVRFTVLECAIAPQENGRPWATDGDAPSFRAAIVSGRRALAKSSEGDMAPFLVPGGETEPPPGNVLEFMERGDLPLTFVLTDTSPTFGSTEVGSIDLGLSLADLPRGSGTLTVERQSSVLVLPEDDANRLHRVVLRWSVER